MSSPRAWCFTTKFSGLLNLNPDKMQPEFNYNSVEKREVPRCLALSIEAAGNRT